MGIAAIGSKVCTIGKNVAKATKTAYGSKAFGVTSKILGAAAIAAVAYDTHCNAKDVAISNERKSSAARYINNYRSSSVLDKDSEVLSKAKDLWFNMKNNINIYNITDRVGGYLKGAGKTIVENLPLIGISAVALKAKKLHKVAGVLLLANGVKTLLYDVMGIGEPKFKSKIKF